MINSTALIPADIPVTHGQNITIPIFLINGIDFQSLTIDLKYDPNILELSSSNNNGFNPNIKTGSLINNWSVFSNVNSELGTVRIISFNTENNSKNTGELIEIDFKIKDDLVLDTTSILDLEKVLLDDFSLTNLNDGSIIISNELPQPDLKATFFDAEIDHVIDANTTVNFTILNQGLTTAENFTVEVYYSQDSNINPQEDILLDTINYDILLGGETLEETLSINIPEEILLNSAETDDLTGLGLNHVSENTNYLGIIVNEENITPEKGLNMDDITYFPWDINQDGKVTPSDIIFIINRLGQNISENDNIRADLNLDNTITIDDINSVYNRLGYTINNNVFND